MKNKFNRGFVGILVLLVVALVGMYLLFKPNKSAQNTDTSQIEHSQNVASETENSTNPDTQNSVAPNNDNNTKDNINSSNKKIMQAVLHTNKGDITIEFNEATPKTAENFIKLSKSGFYDGVKFHRVIKGFMSQGGDPLSKDDTKQAYWGTGGPGYSFADEIKPTNKNNKYTIAMANSGPNTNGSQFFINAADNNFLDNKHTVFGNVIAGMDVADAINKVATDANDRPLEPVVIKSITLK